MPRECVTDRVRSPGRRVGKRQHRKTVTREELLRAGRMLFSERGLYDSRVEDLTARAGIAKGTFYLYFGSKEDLILAVATEAFEELGALVEAETSGASTVGGISRGIVEAHIAFFSANPDLMRVLHQLRGMLKFDRHEWRPLRRAMVAHLERLTARLAGVPPSERLPWRRRRELASLLFGGVSGALSVRVAADSRSRLPARMPGLVDAFVGLALEFSAQER